jgi:iron(III) transport system ATP-binding protein
MAELRCDQITASYGRGDVLSGVDLFVPDGTLIAILGSSGSGKTTLLRVIMGFIAQQHGTVTVGRTVVGQAAGTHLPPEKRSIGYVAQEGALYPHLNVAENVSFGLARRERKESARALEVLDLVGLGACCARRRPHELSGGEQRRVALARALAPRPPVVLLDEPFSGLDAALRAETRAAVLHALAVQGTTAVLVTHDQAEALSMGREVGVLMAGRLIQTAAPDVLYRVPASLDVARFVGEAVVLPGHAGRGVVRCPLGDLPLIDREVTGPVETMIRPEQIHVHRAASGASAWADGRGGVKATVSARTFYGPDSVVQLHLAGVQPPISARVLGHGAPATGERVELTVSGEVMAYPRPGTSADEDLSSEQAALLAGPPSR